MKTKITLASVGSTVAVSLVTSTSALASSSATSNVITNSPLILLFVCFCALVVVFQCIPATRMFCSMIKGIFLASERKSLDVSGN